MLINKTGSTCQSGGQRQILIRRSFSDCLDVCGGRAHSEQVTEQRSSRSELCGRRYLISFNEKWYYVRTGCSGIKSTLFLFLVISLKAVKRYRNLKSPRFDLSYL